MPKNKILVEGKNDGIVICTLCHRHAIEANKFDFKRGKKWESHEIACKGVDGIDKLRDQLDVELDESDLEVMGIIVDADTDLARRWESICDRLRECGYSQLPSTPHPEGTIINEAGKVRVGIWVMPNNQLNGMMEDFVAFLVPEGDGLWPHAQASVAAIEESQRPFGIHTAKANIHTWLAWREKPGTPLGSAIQWRYLDANVPEALTFIAWVRQLFDV